MNDLRSLWYEKQFINLIRIGVLQSGSSLFSFSQYKVEFPWDRVEKALRLKIYYIGSLSLVWNIDLFECML